MSRIERGLRSTSGVVATIELPLLSACILYGTSLEDCHAVNYDTSSGLCEVLSTHGSIMEREQNTDYIFVAFNNKNDLIHTGVQNDCTQGALQWKEQSSRDYIALENVVYSDDKTREGYVCKSTVGENELTGITNKNHECNFVHKDLPGHSDLYRTLVLDPESGFSATWLSYFIGDDIPEGAFAGGHLSTGTPLYVRRAPTDGVQYAGYYDPDTALAYIYSGSVMYPTAVDLLIFSPSGPTTVGPTADWPCPRYHVQVTSTDYEYIEHYGPNGLPSWAVISGNRNAVGETAGAFSTPAKFHQVMYYSVYGDSNGAQNWGNLLKTKIPYQWEPFEAGLDIPYNAFLRAHTINNDPLYIVMAVNARYSIGSYNSRTKSTEMQYYGIVRPTSVHILTLHSHEGPVLGQMPGLTHTVGPSLIFVSNMASQYLVSSASSGHNGRLDFG